LGRSLSTISDWQLLPAPPRLLSAPISHIIYPNSPCQKWKRWNCCSYIFQRWRQCQISVVEEKVV